jgi:hypothetical protein
LRALQVAQIVALASLLGSGACGDAAELQDSASDSRVVELPAWGGQGEDGPLAITSGTLEGDPEEGCVWLVEDLEEGEDLDATMTLMWRAGHVFDTSTMEVLDPDGEPVANVGDDVTLGGGEVPHLEPDRCEASDRIWVVSSVEPS